MIVLDRLIDQVGNVNPQLFRELKERLTLRNISVASAIALTIQSLILFSYNTQLPSLPTYDHAYEVPGKLINEVNKYCIGKFSNEDITTKYSGDTGAIDYLCTVDLEGNFIINWQNWWADVCINSGWIIFSVLILGSVYMLVADLVQEEKRGTMNFIRLSPQSPQQIFIGKILGVPILVYLATAWMIPLHLFSGLNAGANPITMVSWYIAIGSFWFLLSSTAILYVLLGGTQAILTTIAVATPIGLFFKDLSKYLNFGSGSEYGFKDGNWFGLPILKNSAWMYVFESLVFVVISYWIWQALERRYLNPNATAISKSQSYLINIGLQIFIVGFAIPSKDHSDSISYCAVLVAINFTLLLLSTPLLLPNKQVLQDWSRYRRERKNTQQRKFWQRELVQDLLFNDKSPALLAIAINVGMALLLWIPSSLFFAQDSSIGFRFLSCVCIGASLVLIYAAIAHLVLFLNVKKHNLWIMGIIAVVVTLPICVAVIISSGRSPTGLSAIILLFSPFAPAGVFGLSGEIIFAAFMSQLTMLAVLTRQLQRKLQISGQSHSKELLARS